MTSDQAMRASDHDRERAAEVLRHAYMVGCLDLEEFQDRADAAYSAKTWGELRELTEDRQPGKSLAGESMTPIHPPRPPGQTTRRSGRSRASG